MAPVDSAGVPLVWRKKGGKFTWVPKVIGGRPKRCKFCKMLLWRGGSSNPFNKTPHNCVYRLGKDLYLLMRPLQDQAKIPSHIITEANDRVVRQAITYLSRIRKCEYVLKNFIRMHDEELDLQNPLRSSKLK